MVAIFNRERNRYEDRIVADFLQYPYKVRLPRSPVCITNLTTEQREWLEQRGLHEAELGGSVWVYQGYIYFGDEKDAALFKLFFA